MKNKKIIITICILTAIIVLAVIIAVKNVKDNQKNPVTGNENPTEYAHDKCLEKGNVCEIDQIMQGLLVNYKVNEKKEYDFYVIDNDEETLTLIMNDNIKDNVDWHSEAINMKGPLEALVQLYVNCDDWTNVDVIDDYTYEDFGKKYSEDKCAEMTDTTYKCEPTLFDSRGYDKIVIGKSDAYVDFNLVPTEEGEEVLEKYDLSIYNLRARLITVEEIEKLGNPKWLASNLEKDEAFWTASSSTSTNTRYSMGAYAVTLGEESANIESLYVRNSYNSEYNTGIRPVIKIAKR